MIVGTPEGNRQVVGAQIFQGNEDEPESYRRQSEGRIGVFERFRSLLRH